MGVNPGGLLTGRYTLIERIGRGGMSEVWRAHDAVLGRPVAIKVLAPEFTSDPGLREALWREAQAAARLSHPYVTRIYDYGQADIGIGPLVGYLVMELVEGRSLAERLTAGPLRWDQATRVGAQVAAALAAAHEAGVVHRDVKPGNVMLTATGAKVLDFGIAALRGTSSDADGGLAFGTPAYAAPERLTQSGANPASDIYSLGALLYQALTGRPPLPIATWADAAAAHARRSAPAPPRVAGLPPEASGLVMACLAADPERRPTARALTLHLGRAARDSAARHTTARAGGRPSAGPTLAVRAAHLPEFAPGTDGRRVAGTAQAVRRTDPMDPPGPRPLKQPRTPLAVVGGSVALVAAGLALTLLSPALAGDPGAQGAPAVTAPARTPSASPANGTTAIQPLRQWSTKAEAVLAEIDRILAEAVAAGRVRPDAARGLRDELDALRRRMADGKGRDIDERVDKLLDDVRDRLREGTMAPQTAAQLLAAAHLLAAAAPHAASGGS